MTAKQQCNRPNGDGDPWQCACHHQMGVDFWFLPSDKCLFDEGYEACRAARQMAAPVTRETISRIACTLDSDDTEQDGFRIEAAMQYGFYQEPNDDNPHYLCRESQLIAFAKACERKAMLRAISMLQAQNFEGVARGMAYDVIDTLTARCAAIETDNAPIREAATIEFMTARGYARAEPGARWIKVDQSDAAGADFIERRAEKMNHDV